MFKTFLDAGLCVIPLSKGKPLVEWSKYFTIMPEADEVAKWNGKEYALVCGSVSGVIAVDIDIDDTSRIELLAGISPVKKRGSKGFTAFYRYNDEKSQNWKNANGEVICELLSNKRLTTIPPSPHRKTGKPYVWLDQSIIGTELPLLNDDFVLLMDAKYPKTAQTSIKPPHSIVDYEELKLHDAERMLSFISPDCARDEWIQIGMALRDEYGDAACHVWHNWSSKSTKYNHNAAQAAWRSFSGNGVTVGTLVYFAKRGGWLPDNYKSQAEYKGKSRDNPIKSHDNTVNIGGLTGQIADWITATAVRPQPKLSLAAAITFMAMIKGHRVKSSVRGSRTNLLVMSLAPTGGGKDYPQQAIASLFRACGLQRHIMGRPTSGTAMLTGINKAGGVSFLSVDEIGRYLSNATNKNAQSHQREIIDYMVELYSASNRTFYGRQYANEKLNPQVIIEQPHFCCIGSTVIEKFKEACGSAEIIDGFLNRWLVFSVSDKPEKNLKCKDFQPPDNLVSDINKWLESFPMKQDSYGNTEPTEIQLTPEAWNRFLEFEKIIEKKSDSIPYPINELYSRAVEQVIRVATTITDDLFVGIPEIEGAINIVLESIDNVVNFASGLSDNEHERNVNYVLDVIRRAGDDGISKNELTHRTRKLSNRLRTDILNQIVESGEVEHRKDGKKITFFIA